MGYPTENYYRMVSTTDLDAAPGLLNFAFIDFAFGGLYAVKKPGIWSGESWQGNINPVGAVDSNNISYGNDCPITVLNFKCLYPADKNFTPIFGYSSIGRMGDYRGTDVAKADIKLVRLEDETVVADGYLNLTEYCDGKGKSLYSKKWELRTINNNVEVDGLPGCNKAVSHFGEGHRNIQPTLQMLQFRDREGNLTDRFESPEGTMAELMGGLFRFNQGKYIADQWFTLSPKSEAIWKVEYAPHGSEDFIELQTVRNPDLDYMPGYGEYVSVSLGGIDRLSYTGWFDLRIRIETPDGDWQEQTVSPAFKVESLTAVDETERENDGFRIEGHGVTGSEDIRVFGIDGREYPSHSLSPGVYVVRTAFGSRKIIIR